MLPEPVLLVTQSLLDFFYVCAKISIFRPIFKSVYFFVDKRSDIDAVSKPIIIRRCTQGDGPTLCLLRTTMLESAPQAFAVDVEKELTVEPEQWEQRVAESGEGFERVIFFALSDDTPVGMVAAHRSDDIVDFGALWVGPEYRGCGVATNLIANVEMWTLEQPEVRVVRLWTEEKNRTTHRLYEKLGYHQNLDFRTKHDHTELAMVKKIREPKHFDNRNDKDPTSGGETDVGTKRPSLSSRHSRLMRPHGMGRFIQFNDNFGGTKIKNPFGLKIRVSLTGKLRNQVSMDLNLTDQKEI